ncbi:TAXI family TRAP transporter solute-binding subunit [Lentibacillus sp. Marseille-P4043]|uniref:TAXI family TRAP transporter solute-binding subunit n=1 Tax=Lentibacillus sp. Marseille-P4043 TaxID=2040293 RepID=UPI000D0AE674|nr:TAXI family TRAP transporter solute-binding subunit [Lentibacillus sp. Marseille-P4043]
MKKIFFLIILVVLVIMSGCSSGEAGGQKVDSNQVRIFMVPSGNDYLIASGMAQMAKEQDEEISYTISDAAGNMGAIRKVMKGKGELTNIVGSNGKFAYNGTHTFEGEQYEGIRGVVAVPPPIIQFIVRDDSGIDSIADFKDNDMIATFQGTAHMVVEFIMENAGKK